jgi:hypothetical protein
MKKSVNSSKVDREMKFCFVCGFRLSRLAQLLVNLE